MPPLRVVRGLARLFFRCAIVAVLVGVVTAGALLAWRASRQRMIREATAIHSSAGIDSLEQVQLGGVGQWLRVRGSDRNNPVLLILHGGPGVPEMPFEFVNAELERRFTVVEWDQRGAGKSYSSDLPATSMSLTQIVADAEELVDLLRARFRQDRIFLAGHSTGTVIGTLVTARHPEKIRAYIGISQVADLQATETILYEFATRMAVEKSNTQALQELRQIGAPPFSTAEQLQISQKWVNEFAPDRFGALAPDRLKLLFVSPDCTLRDLWRMIRGAKFSFYHLWRDFFSVNLFEKVPRLDVPVYFLQGRNDHVVTAEVASCYFDALEAPRGKQLIWFDQSAHWPQLDEPEKFRRVLVDQILAENAL